MLLRSFVILINTSARTNFFGTDCPVVKNLPSFAGYKLRTLFLLCVLTKHVKVKTLYVNFALKQAIKAQRVNMVIAVLFL